MSISGPDALRSIEEALRDIRREEDEALHHLAHSTELMTKLRSQEAELFRQLSAHGAAPEARDVLTAAVAKAEAALVAHDEGLALLDAKISALDEEIVRISATRAEMRLDAAQHEAQLEALADKVRPGLSSDSFYAAAIERAGKAAAIAEESVKKTAQAEADCARNGRPYRDDPLFMYLWEKGFGSTGYHANVLAAWLDGKIAAIGGFAAARANFALLNDIPLRWREHAEAQQEAARAAAREVANFERGAIDDAGGKATRETMEAMLAETAGHDLQIVMLQDQRDDSIRAARELATGNEPNYATAVSELQAALGRPELPGLLAAAHGSIANANVVQQVEDVRQRVHEQDLEVREEKARLKLLSARRRELEDIQYELKAQGFDGPRSRFARDDLGGEVLNDFLRGEISAAQYWQHWRDSQSWGRAVEWTGRDSAGGTFSRPRGRKAA